jgi:tubulin polyglutamylase TTLL6/13
MLDNKLTPWVIEVNHSPSFTCDSPLDTKIKESVLYDTLRLINLRAADKRRCVAIEKARVTSRLLQVSC